MLLPLVLPIGTNVVVEDGALCCCVMIFGQNHLFLGIGAAYRRAIAVFTGSHPPGPDALDPGDVVGMLQVGCAQDLSCVWPGGAEQPLIVHAGDHVGKLPVVVFLLRLRIKGLKARGQHNRPHIDLFLLRGLLQINGVVLAHPFANAALALFEIKTALIDISDQRNGLLVSMTPLDASLIITEFPASADAHFDPSGLHRTAVIP